MTEIRVYKILFFERATVFRKHKYTIQHTIYKTLYNIQYQLKLVSSITCGGHLSNVTSSNKLSTSF